MIALPHLRDPFVLPLPENGTYCLFGSTDSDIWRGPGTGFDVYIGESLDSWDGPFPAFRPEAGFWGTENFWAPEVHPYRGEYYMFASFKAPGRARATQILRADRPEGPYRVHSPAPVTPAGWECLDGTLFVDDAGMPWLVFCHEWVQIVDGEICAQRLSEDLRAPLGEPLLLFKASQAPWTRAPRRRDGSCNPLSRVTDGPFVHRMTDGWLCMLWSSIGEEGYAMGTALSDGSILGPWRLSAEPLVKTDGGHGMAFRGLDAALYICFHSPNDTPNERFRYLRAFEAAGGLEL